MVSGGSMGATLFFGGWSFFGFGLENIPGLSIVIFLVKVAIFLFLFIWIRATLPRIRYDRLMRLGWTLLLPLAVLNVIITATVVALGWPWWINGLAGLVIIVAVLLYEASRSVRGQKAVPQEKKALPSSIRLAKFEKVSAESSPAVQEAKIL